MSHSSQSTHGLGEALIDKLNQISRRISLFVRSGFPAARLGSFQRFPQSCVFDATIDSARTSEDYGRPGRCRVYHTGYGKMTVVPETYEPHNQRQGKTS